MRKFTFILYILSIIILGLIGAWIGAYVYKINSIGIKATNYYFFMQIMMQLR